MKKGFKSVLALMLAFAMIFALAACGSSSSSTAPASSGSSNSGSSSSSGSSGSTNTSTAASDPVDDFAGVEWTFAHTRTEDSRAAKAAVAFAEAVEKETNGKIKINVQGNGALGDYTTVQERVSLGDVTMQMADFSKQVDPALGLATTPYMISTWEEMDQYLHPGKEGAIIADFSAERLALQNITLISGYPQYFGAICSAKPIPSWEDPSVSKNLKCRVPTEKPYEMMATTFGFQPTGMPASEAYTALQTGTIDSMLGGGTEYYWNQLKDVVDYILPVNTHPTVYFLYINTDAWNSLPEDYQKLVYDLADQYLWDSGFEDAQKEATLYEEYFKEQGSTVYEVTPEIQKAYTDAYRNNVYPTLYAEDTMGLGEAGLEIFGQFLDLYGIEH